MDRLLLVGLWVAAGTACHREAPLAVPSSSSPPFEPSLGAPHASPADGPQADRYAFDVKVVDQPPLAIFLLSRFSEPPGEGCSAHLLDHARGLGANRLYVERGEPCTGRAYFVRPGSPPTSPRVNASLREWLLARWQRPASITADDAARLCVVIQFSVSPLRRVWKVNGQPLRPSGNRDFDESVRAALESAIDDHALVPAPPDDLVGEYVETRVAFTEGDPRSCLDGRPVKPSL
jgi:hypothetical protein